MSEVLDRTAGMSVEAFDVLRARTMDDLEAAQAALQECALEAALPGGSDKPMLEAEKAVERIRLKLQGLALGRKRAREAQDREEAARRAVEGRGQAVDVLSLVHQRDWATDELDHAIGLVGSALMKIEHLGNDIAFAVGAVSAGIERGEEHAKGFLMFINAIDMTDTVYQFNQATGGGRLGQYSKALLPARPSALRTLAKLFPAAADPEVRAEAVSVARAKWTAQADG